MTIVTDEMVKKMIAAWNDPRVHTIFDDQGLLVCARNTKDRWRLTLEAVVDDIWNIAREACARAADSDRPGGCDYDFGWRDGSSAAAERIRSLKSQEQ